MAFSWAPDENDVFARPAEQQPLVALYDGFGLVGNARKPLVIAMLGTGERTFLASWLVYEEDAVSWIRAMPVRNKSALCVVGKKLYVCSSAGIDVFEAEVWALHMHTCC